MSTGVLASLNNELGESYHIMEESVIWNLSYVNENPDLHKYICQGNFAVLEDVLYYVETVDTIDGAHSPMMKRINVLSNQWKPVVDVINTKLAENKEWLKSYLGPSPARKWEKITKPAKLDEEGESKYKTFEDNLKL